MRDKNALFAWFASSASIFARRRSRVAISISLLNRSFCSLRLSLSSRSKRFALNDNLNDSRFHANFHVNNASGHSASAKNRYPGQKNNMIDDTYPQHAQNAKIHARSMSFVFRSCACSAMYALRQNKKIRVYPAMIAPLRNTRIQTHAQSVSPCAFTMQWVRAMYAPPPVK